MSDLPEDDQLPPTVSDPGTADHKDLGTDVPRIEGYQITGRLGQGGMGVVWGAVQLSTHREVALKLLGTGSFASDKARLRFEREVDLAAALEHPNIARVYDSGLHRGVYYYAMELVRGVPLDVHVRERKLTQRQILELMRTVAEAVQHAHQRGVIHRDLKSTNILVSEDGQPHVLDFGLAKSLLKDEAQLTVTEDGDVSGTPAYMSPEQAGGHHARVDTRSDVYSLGVMLFRLLTDAWPHDLTGTRYEVLRRIAEEEVRRPREVTRTVDRELEALLLKALARDQEDRYASAGELAQDISNYLEGDPLSARPPRLGYFLRKRLWKSRRPLAAGLVVAVALAAAVAGTVHFASKASLARRIAELTQSFESGLDASKWTESDLTRLESIVRDLGLLAPEQASAASGRLNQQFAVSIRETIRRPSLEVEDIRHIESTIDLLARRDPDAASELRKAFGERLRVWQPVFELKPPFADLATVFDADVTRVENDLLVLKEPGTAPEAVEVLSRVPCRGAVQLEAVLSPSWVDACEVGLRLNASGSSSSTGPSTGSGPPAASRGGYSFMLCVPKHSATRYEGRKKGERITFASVGEVGRALSLVILRDGVQIREKSLWASEVPRGELRLVASRERDRLTFQVNDLPAMVFHDAFATGTAEEGCFGVSWPGEVRIARLRASRQPLPVTPSALERADDLYSRGNLAEALDYYRRQAVEAVDVRFSQEARYKEGLCLAGLGRDADAERVFDQLAAQPGESWPALAACQLWLSHLQHGRVQEAEGLFTYLSARYPLEELATLVPDELGRQIIGVYRDKAFGSQVFLFDPARVRNIETVAAVQNLLGESGRELFMTHWALVRACRLTGSPERAAEVAEKLLHDEKLRSRDVVEQHYACEEYAWMLRLVGEHDRALAEIDQLLFEKPGVYRDDGYSLLVPRCRVHTATEQYDLAEKDLDEYFRLAQGKRRNYTAYPAACLMQGFLRERRGDVAGALEAWRRGLFKGNADGKPEQTVTSRDPAVKHYGQDLLYLSILGSLTNELSEAELESLVDSALFGEHRGLTPPLSRETFKPFLSVLKPVLCRMWASPRGRACARRMAFQEVDFPEYVRIPVVLTATEVMREQAFADGMTEEEETLVWKTIEDTWAAYTAGKLAWGPVQLTQMVLAWKGTKGFLGWAGVAPTLGPALRGPFAYVFGHRYLRLGRPEDAAGFFSTASEDAEEDSTLQRLARAELEQLKKPEENR